MEWDFSQNQEIDEDTLGKAPESYRGAYAKGDDGKFRIADQFKPFVDTIVGLGGALKGERNVTKDLKGRKDASEQLQALGFDSFDSVKAKIDEMTAQIATASKVDPAKIRADIEKVFNADKQKLEDGNKAMKKTLEKYMIESAAISALAEAKGNQTLLMPLVRERVELVQDGDDYVVRVKDGAGDYRGNGRGGFMSVAELVTEMKAQKDYSAAFESDAPLGAQRPIRGQPPTQGHRRQSEEPVSGTDRIQRGLQQRRGGR